MSKPFLPADFDVPQSLETANFRLRMLTIHDVIKDYDAVMSSVDYLVGIFGDDSPWPVGLTIEQDLIDLGWHHKEFQRRTSFTYTVMSLDESSCLGCVYLFPSDDDAADVDVFLWARQSESDKGTEAVLAETVKGWLAAIWPFSTVRYPARRV